MLKFCILLDLALLKTDSLFKYCTQLNDEDIEVSDRDSVHFVFNGVNKEALFIE